MIKPFILIVDDEKDVRDELAAFLSARLDCEIAVCASGEEAVKVLEERPVRVLIQDLHMPGLGGFEVLERAKKKDKTIIALVITKWDDPGYTRRIEDAGAIYVPKPLALKAVLKIIETELKRPDR